MNYLESRSVEGRLRDLSREGFNLSRNGYRGIEVSLSSPILFSVLECRAYVYGAIAQYLANNPHVENALAQHFGNLREHYIRYARGGESVDLSAMTEAQSDADAKVVWITTGVNDCDHIYERVRKRVDDVMKEPMVRQFEIAKEQRKTLDVWVANVIEKFVLR